MTTLDLHTAHPLRHDWARSDIAAALSAAALVILMGIPALMAPEAKIKANGWHGNAAASTAMY